VEGSRVESRVYRGAILADLGASEAVNVVSRRRLDRGSRDATLVLGDGGGQGQGRDEPFRGRGRDIGFRV
jgi:hypothetical protein